MALTTAYHTKYRDPDFGDSYEFSDLKWNMNGDRHAIFTMAFQRKESQPMLGSLQKHSSDIWKIMKSFKASLDQLLYWYYPSGIFAGGFKWCRIV